MAARTGLPPPLAVKPRVRASEVDAMCLYDLPAGIDAYMHTWQHIHSGTFRHYSNSVAVLWLYLRAGMPFPL